MADNEKNFDIIKENQSLKRDYSEELLTLIRSNLSPEVIKDELDNYHESDIADIIPSLSKEERIKLYKILGVETVSDIFAHLDNVEDYVDELSNDKVADILGEMDADDAIDVLDELDEDKKEQLIELLDENAAKDIKLLDAYDENLIGSRMTTNFISVKKSWTVKEAMKSVIQQAAENDNISTIYATNDDDTFYGAIELKDLVIARQSTPLDDTISTAYPFVYATEEVNACIEELKDYSEDSIPVLDKNNKILGVITSSELVEVVDGEMAEDYAKLAGLTEEEDLNEPLIKSIKKRLPWLAILMVMGSIVSILVGSFSMVISLLPILCCFQSLILDMSGNCGTQSLAVTIRSITAENLSVKEKFKLIWKELRIGVTNGIIMSIIATIFCSAFIYFFIGKQYNITTYSESILIASCIGFSLLVAMTVSSLSGTLIPLLFKKLKVDPAVASGPFITTLNDLFAASVYYGLSWLFLLNIFKIV